MTSLDSQEVAAPVQDPHGSRNITILYATETGNAQDAADRIAISCRRIRLACRVVSMDAYPLVSLQQPFLPTRKI